MKKKTILAAAIALATASAMTFAPVSYKVIDKAYAAAPQDHTDKAEAVQTLKDVYEKLKLEANAPLAEAYTELLAVAKTDVGTLEFVSDLPYLHDVLAGNSGAVQSALIAFVKQAIDDYGVESTNLGDVSQDFETALENLNNALDAAGLIKDNHFITTDDAAKFLLALEDALLDEAEEFDLASVNLVDEVLDAVVDFADEQWEATEVNGIVAVLKAAYTTIENLKSDIDTLKANIKDELDANTAKKSIYKNGALALAIAYAQDYLEKNPPLAASYTGRTVELQPNLLGLSGFPLTALAWTTNSNQHSIGNRLEETGVLKLTVSGYGSVTVTVIADLKSFTGVIPGIDIPEDFEGINLFSQDITVKAPYSNNDGDTTTTPSELNLVSDYQQKAAEISTKVNDYISENPELDNNTAVYGLKKTVEEALRQALTVAAANATTVVNGVTTLNLTTEQLNVIYQQQLKAVLDANKAALEAADASINATPTLTFNVGVALNAEVNLSKAVIDSLESNGIANVAVRTGDVVVESAVDQLDNAAKLGIKKSSAAVEGAKSDVYSLSVTDANGKDVLGFEQQYRVTLPVTGDGSNITVAMLGDGSQTLVGGKYDPETKTITFYTNVLGDFVVVENKTEFNDTADLDWAKDSIQLLADKGILQGKGEGQFDPQSNVTRAEFTAMIVRTLNLSVDADLTFEDVPENAWYHDVIAAAFTYGIINGRSAEEFDPNAPISREEMATVAANALKAVLGYVAPENIEEILSKFNDGNKVVSVHRENVALLANDGIVQGKGNDNYDPKGNASRAEVAVIIASIFNAR